MPSASFGSVKLFYPAYDRATLLGLLRARLPALVAVLPLERVVLFGSQASGRATAFSDIDLLVVYAGPPRDDAYAVVKRTLSLRGLEPHVYTAAEAARLAPTIERMTRGGIELWCGD